MGLKTTCSNCGTSFAMKNRDMEGKKVKCKSCGDPFVVSFTSGGGNGGGGTATGGLPPKMGGLPPKTVGQKAPQKVSTPAAEEAPPANAGGPSKTKLLIIGGSVVAVLAIWTGIMFAIGSRGGGETEKAEPVQLVLTHGRSEQGRYGVDYPQDWSFKTGGGTGGKPEFIRIETEGVSVSIKTNLKASALGDIAGAGAPSDTELPDELEPIAKVHEAMRADMEVDMSPYDEQPAEKVETNMGNSRLSKFVGDRGMLNGGKAYGYRATLPCGPDKLKVVITCDSEKLFNQYEPTLRQLVLSIGSQ